MRKPGQQHVLLEMMLAHQVFQVLAQLAFAEDDEAGVGNLLHDQVRRLDQVALALVRHERGDIADDRRMMRQPERFVNVDRRRGVDVIDVDAFVHRDRSVGRHAVADQHLPDGVRRGDEAVDLPVLPARKRIRLEMEVDAPRGDERRRRPPASPTPRRATAPARPSRRRAGRARGSRRAAAA